MMSHYELMRYNADSRVEVRCKGDPSPGPQPEGGNEVPQRGLGMEGTELSKMDCPQYVDGKIKPISSDFDASKMVTHSHTVLKLMLCILFGRVFIFRM